MLAEFGDEPVAHAFTKSNRFSGVSIADPFMGGGTPLIEANRLGCDVLGFDINPMAYWIVRQELEHLDLGLYRETAAALVAYLQGEIGHLYQTQCACGERASAKYFLWVKRHECPSCRRDFDLSPGHLMAKDSRHTAHVVLCGECGELNEREDLDELGECDSCNVALHLEGNAKRNKATCPHCAHVSRYPNPEQVPRHRLHAIEYHCHACRPTHRGRFFKKPDAADLAAAEDVRDRLERMRCRFVPDDLIPKGDESNRLHRWGYQRYRDLFNERQLVGLELAARWIDKVKDDRVRNALATNLSDLLRYQNLLCRYDTMALKSLDIFSVHGFPVSLVQCESNMLGIVGKRGGNVGSGGWTNIVEKFAKAKAYCDRPFETIGKGSKKQVIYTEEEWIGDRLNGTVERRIDVRAADSAAAQLQPESLDAVLTDPPYFGMVQYAELMDFCYVWLRRLVGEGLAEFNASSTRSANELTGNQTHGRGLDHFAAGISRVFQTMGSALKTGRPLAFTFHHNQLSSYAAIGVAILDAGLPCTETLPCPAEMGGSIHINNTASSILDTVFVCRKGAEAIDHHERPAEALAIDLARDIVALAAADYRATAGDLNCLLNGHTCRHTINRLVGRWDRDACIHDKVQRFTAEAAGLVDRTAVLNRAKAHAAEQTKPAVSVRTGNLFTTTGVPT